MTAGDIDEAYNGLVSSIDRESRRLKQILAEQQMKDEEERLKKIQNELEREKTKKSNEDKQFEQDKEDFRQYEVYFLSLLLIDFCELDVQLWFNDNEKKNS